MSTSRTFVQIVEDEAMNGEGPIYLSADEYEMVIANVTHRFGGPFYDAADPQRRPLLWGRPCEVRDGN